MAGDSVEVKNLLPQKWVYEVYYTNYERERNVTKIKFMLQADTVEEIKQWIHDYEQMHKLTYAVRSSEKGKGCKLIYKVRMCCQHNTGCERLYSKVAKNKTKNTKCPSFMKITLHAERMKNSYQGKNEFLLNSEFRCEVTLVPDHNHFTDCPDALKFRRVAEDTNNELLELYKNGHTPSTALEVIKSNIQLQTQNPEILLADRSICPDYTYCYRLYTKHYGPLKKGKDYKQARIRKPTVQKSKAEKSLDSIYNQQLPKSSVSFYPSNLEYKVVRNIEEIVPLKIKDMEQVNLEQILKPTSKGYVVEENRDYYVKPIQSEPVEENKNYSDKPSTEDIPIEIQSENNASLENDRKDIMPISYSIEESDNFGNKTPVKTDTVEENRISYFPPDLDIPSVTFLHVTDDDNDINEDDEATIEVVKEAENLIQQMNDQIRQFLSKSPEDVRDGLRNMVSNIEQIKSVSDFISSCDSFGKGYTIIGSNRQKSKMTNQPDDSEERPQKIVKIHQNIYLN